MKKMIFSLSVILMALNSVPSFANGDNIPMAQNTTSATTQNQNETPTLFVSATVAQDVINKYFGNMVSSGRFSFDTELTDVDILATVLDAYKEMLDETGGVVSIDGLARVCGAAFQHVKLTSDAPGGATTQNGLDKYCQDFATELVTTKKTDPDECIYNVGKVNNSQTKIKFERKDGTGGFIRSGGTLAWRFFNPGAMRRSPLQCSSIKTNPNGVFAVFDSYESGHQALWNLFKTPSYQRLTVARAIARYAPPTENNTRRYIAQIGAHGINTNALISSLNDEKLSFLISVIERIEGNTKSGTVENF